MRSRECWAARWRRRTSRRTCRDRMHADRRRATTGSHARTATPGAIASGELHEREHRCAAIRGASLGPDRQDDGDCTSDGKETRAHWYGEARQRPAADGSSGQRREQRERPQRRRRDVAHVLDDLRQQQWARRHQRRRDHAGGAAVESRRQPVGAKDSSARRSNGPTKKGPFSPPTTNAIAMVSGRPGG